MARSRQSSRARDNDSSETVRTSSTSSLHDLEGQPAGAADGDAIGHRGHRLEGDRLAGDQRRGIGRRILGLHTDDAHVGTQRLDRDGDAGEQPAAAGAHHHGLDVGHLLEDLQAGGARPGNDVLVVEGVHEDRAGLVAERLRGHERLVDDVPVEAHLGAVRACRLDLGDWRALRHEHRCPDAEQRGRERDPLRVVAGAGRDDTARGFVGGQPGQAGVGAADLERPRALQVLALEPDRPADPFRERA